MTGQDTRFNLDTTSPTHSSPSIGTWEVGIPPTPEGTAVPAITAAPQQRVVAGSASVNVEEIPTAQEQAITQDIPDAQAIDRPKEQVIKVATRPPADAAHAGDGHRLDAGIRAAAKLAALWKPGGEFEARNAEQALVRTQQKSSASSLKATDMSFGARRTRTASTRPSQWRSGGGVA